MHPKGKSKGIYHTCLTSNEAEMLSICNSTYIFERFLGKHTYWLKNMWCHMFNSCVQLV